MLKFIKTPVQLAWDMVMERNNKIENKKFGLYGLPTIFACSDCLMPIDEKLQRTNIRLKRFKDEDVIILSCPWCHCVVSCGVIT